MVFLEIFLEFGGGDWGNSNLWISCEFSHLFWFWVAWVTTQTFPTARIKDITKWMQWSMKWRRACRPWREVLDLLAPQLLLQLLMCGGQYWRVAKDVKLVCDFSQTKSKETKTWHLDVFSDVLFQPFKMIGEAMFYPAMTKSWGSFPGVSFSGTNFQQLASVPERCETAQLLEALDSQAGNLWAID